MTDELQKLIEKARSTEMTPEERETQRQSFAYGNAKFENPRITRESVRRASQALKDSPNGGEGQPAK